MLVLRQAGERIDRRRLAFAVEDVRVEEVLGQRHVGRRRSWPLLPCRSIVAAQQAVAEAEGHGGELGGDRWLDVGVVARVGRQRIRPQHGGNPLVVDDRLVLGDVELAGFVEELLVGPGRDSPSAVRAAMPVVVARNSVCRAVSSTFSLPRVSPVTNICDSGSGPSSAMPPTDALIAANWVGVK